MALYVAEFKAPLGNNLANIVLTLTTTPNPGDLLITAISFSQFGATRTVPAIAGWTQIDTFTLSNDSVSTFYRIAQAGDSLTWTWTINSSSGQDKSSGVIFRVVGASTVAPINAHTVTGPGSSTTVFTTAPATPSVVGCLPVSVLAYDGGSGTNANTSVSNGWTRDPSSNFGHASYSAYYATLTTDTVTPVSNTFTINAANRGVITLMLIAPGTPTGVDNTQSAAETLAPSDTLKRKPTKKGADSLALLDSGARSSTKKLADITTLSELFSKALSSLQVRTLALLDAVGLSDAVRRAARKSTRDTASISDAIKRTTGKRTADNLGVTDRISRALHKLMLLADTLSVTDRFSRALRKVLQLADSVTPSDIIALLKASLSLATDFKTYVVSAWQRTWAASVALRAWTPAQITRSWRATEVTINADPKKAKAVEDFQLDWSVNIGTDTITASTWTVPPGLTAASQSFTGTTARVRLSGGVVGKGYTVSNTVTLASGQVKVQDIYIPVC